MFVQAKKNFRKEFDFCKKKVRIKKGDLTKAEKVYHKPLLNKVWIYLEFQRNCC
eukprot:UN24426